MEYRSEKIHLWKDLERFLGRHLPTTTITVYYFHVHCKSNLHMETIIFALIATTLAYCFNVGIENV